jgi:hypothetical protein
MVSLTLFFPFLLFSPQTSISLFLELNGFGMHPPLPCLALPCPLDYSMTSQLYFLYLAQRASVFQPFPHQALSSQLSQGCLRAYTSACSSPCTFAPEKAPRPRATGNLPLSTPSNMSYYSRPLTFFFLILSSSQIPPASPRSHIDRFSLVLVKVSLVRPHIDQISVYVSA